MRFARSTTLLIGFAILAATAQAQTVPPAGARGAGGGTPMTITNSGWPDGGQIPPKYTQAGDQVSPGLTFNNAPAGTMSFVVHMHDMDVAQNKGLDDQVHWLVWSIPGSSKGLAEGQPAGAQLPDGSRQISASGPSYRGPGAPATGPLHHYTIEVFALDTMLDVQPAANVLEPRANVMKAMTGHILGKAVYYGLFHRPQ